MVWYISRGGLFHFLLDKNKCGIHKEAVTQLLKRCFLKDVELYAVQSWAPPRSGICILVKKEGGRVSFKERGMVFVRRRQRCGGVFYSPGKVLNGHC